MPDTSDLTKFFPRSWKLYEGGQAYAYFDSPKGKEGKWTSERGPWGDEVHKVQPYKVYYDPKFKMGMAKVKPHETEIPVHLLHKTPAEAKAARMLAKKKIYAKKGFPPGKEVTIAWPSHPDYKKVGAVPARVVAKLWGGLHVKLPSGAFDVIPWIVYHHTADHLAEMAMKEREEQETKVKKEQLKAKVDTTKAKLLADLKKIDSSNKSYEDKYQAKSKLIEKLKLEFGEIIPSYWYSQQESAAKQAYEQAKKDVAAKQIADLKPEVDKIQHNPSLNEEQKTKQILKLYDQAVKDGKLLKTVAKDLKSAARSALREHKRQQGWIELGNRLKAIENLGYPLKEIYNLKKDALNNFPYKKYEIPKLDIQKNLSALKDEYASELEKWEHEALQSKYGKGIASVLEIEDAMVEVEGELYSIIGLDEKDPSQVVLYSIAEEHGRIFPANDVKEVKRKLSNSDILTVLGSSLNMGQFFVSPHKSKAIIPLLDLELEFGDGWVRFVPGGGRDSYKVPLTYLWTEIEKYPDNAIQAADDQVPKKRAPKLTKTMRKDIVSVMKPSLVKKNALGDTTAKKKRNACSHMTNEIMERYGVRALNNNLLSSWGANSANGRCSIAKAMKSLGLLTKVNDFTAKECGVKSAADLSPATEEMKTWLKLRYHITQRYLKETREEEEDPYKDVVEVYRGLRMAEGAQYKGVSGYAEYFPCPVSSWSVNFVSAKEFATSVVIAAQFPLSMILFSYIDTSVLYNNFGGEREYVVWFPGDSKCIVKVIQVGGL